MCNVVSLFAGCGGSSLGYRLAGARVRAAIECDPHAAAIYQDNFPDTHLLMSDIATLCPQNLFQKINLDVGELDILDGSPPCQGFSLAGRRRIHDPRNQLFLEYVRFLKALQPKAFVMENVPGLVAGRMRGIFSEIMTTLSSAGYVVRARILNAAHYGVAQNRKRVIILGIRADQDLIPAHPRPHSVPVSFRQAVANLTDPGLIARPSGRALALAKALRPGESGATLHTRYRHKANDYSLQRLHWDKPAPTICRTIRPGQCGLLHPVEDRYLGIAELKRLCSFPDDFQLSGTFEQQWGRLGNAVPPLLMRAIAQTVIQQLGEASDAQKA